ncbi:MAG: tetratricopeptide repeat protein [Ignavibacteriales bacterium]
MHKIILIVLLFSVRVFAQNEIYGLIYKGLDYSYNFQIQEAETEFQKIINSYPSDPRGYHYKSSLYLWLFLSNKEKGDYDRFLRLSDLAIEKARNVLDNKDNDENALYVLGANYGFRAMAFMKNNSSLDAIWAAKSSNKYLSETLEHYPQNNDAYLGKGLFSYALSMVPGVFKWALNLAGFSGSQSDGINYLKKAYKYGKFARTEAAYYLSQIYSEANGDYETSAGYLQQLIKKYPHNSLFQYSYAVVLIKDRKPQEAEKALREIIRLNNERFQQISSFSYFLLGDIYFHKNEFSSAINYYQKFLTTTKDFDYSGIAYYRTALSYEISKNRREAQKNYILARNGNLDIPDDIFAKREGEKYYDKPLTEGEISLIIAANDIESARFNEAYNMLIQILQKYSDERLKCETYLYLSDVCYELGKNGEAIDYATKAVRLNPRDEKWIKPYSYYYGARAYWRSGNKQMAAQFLDKAEDFKDYDYQSKLTGFIKALKQKL